MKDDKKRFTLRLSKEKAAKFLYIAKYEDCTKNSLLVYLLNCYIRKFERDNGVIEIKNDE